MSKRYGRQQKRKARQHLEAKELELQKYKSYWLNSSSENYVMKQIIKNSINVDVECLRPDLGERVFEIRCRMQKKDWPDVLWYAERVREIEIKMAKNKEYFIDYISQRIARRIANQVGSLYKGKEFKFEEEMK